MIDVINWEKSATDWTGNRWGRGIQQQWPRSGHVTSARESFPVEVLAGWFSLSRQEVVGVFSWSL